jgi:hypothetical protein
MAKTYTYSQARQNLASVLMQAEKDGEVVITHRDGRRFIVKLASPERSPLDVPGIKTNITREEIVNSVREGRDAARYEVKK